MEELNGKFDHSEVGEGAATVALPLDLEAVKGVLGGGQTFFDETELAAATTRSGDVPLPPLARFLLA